MDNTNMNTKKKQVKGGSSSFTADLFGPKDSSPPSSSTGLFGSVFGPPSTGLGKNPSHSGTNKHDPKYANTEYMSQRGKGESVAEPCYFSSSIYYGGQEVYAPNANTQSSVSHHTSKKDDGNDDPNGSGSNSASRGNWWQGSLYY